MNIMRGYRPIRAAFHKSRETILFKERQTHIIVCHTWTPAENHVSISLYRAFEIWRFENYAFLYYNSLFKQDCRSGVIIAELRRARIYFRWIFYWYYIRFAKKRVRLSMQLSLQLSNSRAAFSQQHMYDGLHSDRRWKFYELRLTLNLDSKAALVIKWPVFI